MALQGVSEGSCASIGHFWKGVKSFGWALEVLGGVRCYLKVDAWNWHGFERVWKSLRGFERALGEFAGV